MNNIEKNNFNEPVLHITNAKTAKEGKALLLEAQGYAFAKDNFI